MHHWLFPKNWTLLGQEIPMSHLQGLFLCHYDLKALKRDVKKVFHSFHALQSIAEICFAWEKKCQPSVAFWLQKKKNNVLGQRAKESILWHRCQRFNTDTDLQIYNSCSRLNRTVLDHCKTSRKISHWNHARSFNSVVWRFSMSLHD